MLFVSVPNQLPRIGQSLRGTPRAQPDRRTPIVPVPDDGETVTEALLNALFLRRANRDREAVQLTFDLGGANEQVEALHRRWDRDVERERINRTRFAQRTIKPGAVQRELEAADEVLGDPGAVRGFVLKSGAEGQSIYFQ